MSYYVPKKDLEDLKEIKPSTANIRNRDLGVAVIPALNQLYVRV
jgi:nitrogen fixation protein